MNIISLEDNLSVDAKSLSIQNELLFWTLNVDI